MAVYSEDRLQRRLYLSSTSSEPEQQLEEVELSRVYVYSSILQHHFIMVFENIWTHGISRESKNTVEIHG